MIIVTAGHVDHGKTALVHALTGVDTDRLPEEKARGLTIDIGFAYMRLPGSRPDGRLLGFVDVPGHQRFIRNMLAGVGNVDHALIVVAADDGVMPQTVEHVEILDLIGVACATVAITKVDKAEASRGDEVELQIRTLLARTGIGVDRVFRTSARSGDGIATLSAHLAALASAHASAVPTGHLRLAVDRAFTLRGVGVVVTGSVHAGMAQAGDAVTVAPAGHAARVRALRIHDADVASVQAGDRCAIQLSGISLDEVSRGVWITAGPNQVTRRIDVALRLRGEESESARPLRHWTPAHLHIGAEDLTCRVALISAESGTKSGAKSVPPGATAMAALHLDRPIAAWAAQRFILRDQSAQQTLGGGTVLDPLPPPRQNVAVRLARLKALDAPDAAAAFANMLALSVRGFDLDAFALSWNLTLPECKKLAAAHNARVLTDGDTKIALRADHWQALLDDAANVLRACHHSHPERLGLPEAGISTALRPPVAPVLVRGAVTELCDAGILARRGVILHLAGHTAQPTPAEADLWRRIEPALAADGVRPPRVRELVDRLGIALAPLETFLARAEDLGWVHRVADNRWFLPGTLDELERIAAGLAAKSPDGTFTASEFNGASGIGRNLTIQVLEYFDRTGVTRRYGDRRLYARVDLYRI
jgi:selenocysteine-specific elongation factor